jgi:hypothetical protein
MDMEYEERKEQDQEKRLLLLIVLTFIHDFIGLFIVFSYSNYFG